MFLRVHKVFLKCFLNCSQIAPVYRKLPITRHPGGCWILHLYLMIFYCRKPVDEVKKTVGSERRGSQPIRGHYPGDVTTLDQSERRGSVPNMERMRLARRRKSIPAYLGKSRKRSFPYLSVHILILSPDKSTLGFREAFTKKELYGIFHNCRGSAMSIP